MFARGWGRAGLLPALACTALVSAGASAGTSAGEATGSRPQVQAVEIKAAYLYNFLLFAEWPEEGGPGELASSPGADAAAPVERPAASREAGTETVIGIVGEDPFGNAFAEVEGKYDEALGSTLVIVRFGPYHEGMILTPCHLLFVTDTESENLPSILGAIEGSPVLTVGEEEGFLEAGGMINLLVRRNRLRWEINYAAANAAGIQLSSQLLRNAVRVIEQDEG